MADPTGINAVEAPSANEAHAMIRPGKDFYSGLLFLFFGAAGLVLGHHLSMGAMRSMGPGAVPIAVSWALVGIGTIVALRGFSTANDLDRVLVRLRSLIPVVASVLIFAGFVRPFGLAAAVFTSAMVAGLGGQSTRWGESVALSFGLGAAACLVFVYGIGLPLKVFP